MLVENVVEALILMLGLGSLLIVMRDRLKVR